MAQTQQERADEARIKVLSAKGRMWELLGATLATIALLLTLPAIIFAVGLVKIAWRFMQTAGWQ